MRFAPTDVTSEADGKAAVQLTLDSFGHLVIGTIGMALPQTVTAPVEAKAGV